MTSRYIHQLSVSFFVVGGITSPNELSAQLGIEPSHLFVKGSPRLNSQGSEVGTHKENLWGFNSPVLPNEPEIDVHASYILNAIEPHASYLLNLPESANLFLEIQCALEEPFCSTSFVIESGLLSRLNNLKISVGFVFRIVKNGCP